MIPFPFQAGQLGFSAQESDPYFSLVSLLLHGQGPNGSTTFYDSSSTHKTPSSVFGNAQISTSNPLFGGSSILMDGAGDAILYAHSADMHLTGDFTIEFWFFPVSHTIPTYSFPLCKGGGGGIAYASYEVAYDAQYLTFAASSANTSYDIGGENNATGRIGSPTTGAWNHVAITRSGNVYRGFLNGVQGYTQTLALTPYDSSPRGLCVGANFTTTWGSGIPTYSIDGQMREVRITKGAARYTANFTPPNAPFPNS